MPSMETLLDAYDAVKVGSGWDMDRRLRQRDAFRARILRMDAEKDYEISGWIKSVKMRDRQMGIQKQQLAEKDTEIEDLILQANIRMEYLETKLAEKDTENKRLRELLREMEFKAYDEKFNDNYCLICDANETDGHKDDCRLMKELSDG